MSAPNDTSAPLDRALRPDERLAITLTHDQFCALLAGTSYACGAMSRDACATQSTIEWLAEAADALRDGLRVKDT